MSEKTLLLLPMPLYEGTDDLPRMTLEAFRTTTCYIAERARTLRRFLSKIKHPTPIDHLHIIELDKHDPGAILSQLKKLFKEHNRVGIASEAGTPCIADPGFRVTAWAHQNNVGVRPLPGPNSMMMALMASGFEGQTFRFHGYLSAKKNLLDKDLQRLEKESLQDRTPQIFIEAPYRNLQVFESACRVLNPQTFLHISIDLDAPEGLSITKTIHQWKQSDEPGMHKRPAVFIIFAGRGTSTLN